jgi:tetratricopeptide (TPR) repeat protein
MVSAVRQQGTGVELVDTPFYAQVTDQCGPAALASVLEVSGITAPPEALKSRVYIPGREGSLQIELLAATRAYQRVPYLIDPEITALLGELRDGRPVLVLQNLGTTLTPVWHYAVVVGYMPNEKRFVLRSGDQDRQLVRISRFIRSWQRADYWGMVVLRPGEMPAIPDADKYIRSVAAVEAIGDFESAVAGYHAATERWPGKSLAWLGLGNAYYAQGDLDSAEAAYKRSLSIDSDNAVVLNNLSQVQADRGRYEEASATLDTALSAVEPNTALHKIIEESLQQIKSQ